MQGGGGQTSGHQKGGRSQGLLVELQKEMLAGGCYEEDMTEDKVVRLVQEGLVEREASGFRLLGVRQDMRPGIMAGRGDSLWWLGGASCCLTGPGIWQWCWQYGRLLATKWDAGQLGTFLFYKY